MSYGQDETYPILSRAFTLKDTASSAGDSSDLYRTLTFSNLTAPFAGHLLWFDSSIVCNAASEGSLLKARILSVETM